MEYTQLSLEQKIETVRGRLAAAERDHFDQTLNIEADQAAGIEVDPEYNVRTANLAEQAQRITYFRAMLASLVAEKEANDEAAAQQG